MGDGRWEDGAHSLDQLSSGAMLEDEEEPQTEAVEVVAVTAAAAARGTYFAKKAQKCPRGTLQM